MDPEQVHRKIIHLDMDAFYASVDQRDFPEYRGKAIAVGGSPDGRGVVATASWRQICDELPKGSSVVPPYYLYLSSF